MSVFHKQVRSCETSDLSIKMGRRPDSWVGVPNRHVTWNRPTKRERTIANIPSSTQPTPKYDRPIKHKNRIMSNKLEPNQLTRRVTWTASRTVQPLLAYRSPGGESVLGPDLRRSDGSWVWLGCINISFTSYSPGRSLPHMSCVVTGLYMSGWFLGSNCSPVGSFALVRTRFKHSVSHVGVRSVVGRCVLDGIFAMVLSRFCAPISCNMSIRDL
jgi:hypothetical protein